MSGHGVSAKLLHLAGGDEPEWGEGGGGEDGYAYGDEEEEEEEVIEVDEADVLKYLDAQEDPFRVCSRLFRDGDVHLNVLTEEAAGSLRSNGFAVVDDFLDLATVAGAREEALGLFREGAFTPATSNAHLAPNSQGAHFTDINARGDSLMWLHPGERPSAPNLEAAVSALQRLQADLGQMVALRRHTAEYQLAVYPGHGAKYTRHRDALPDDGSEEEQRRVTAVLYLNPPDWDAATLGGCLRVFRPACHGGGSVDVEPLPGRLVLFLSGAIDHEVMPSFGIRVAISAWCQ